MTQLCESCKFFSKSGNRNVCRRYPPKVFGISTDGGISDFQRLPVVKEKEFCGEYCPKDDKR